MSKVGEYYFNAMVGTGEPVSFRELRATLLDIVDGRAKLTDRQVDDLYAAVDTARYFLRREKDSRDALKATGDCHQIEGAPV
jgi:hypothetical protein